MRKFAGVLPDMQFVQQVAAQISWYHHIALMDNVKDPADREWNIRGTIRHGRKSMTFPVTSGSYPGHTL